MFVKENPKKKKKKFLENVQSQRAILKLLSIILKNFFLSEWRCGDGSRIAETSKIALSKTIVHGCQPLKVIVTTSFILDHSIVRWYPLSFSESSTNSE